MSGQAAAPRPVPPLAWVRRFAPLLAPGSTVLDLACGAGRHSRYLLELGHQVTALDRDLASMADLAGQPGLELIAADLEQAAWPLPGRRFAGIVVTNYLWRPLWPDLLAALGPDGLLLYETFGLGQAAFGRPRDPAFLLAPGELLERVRGSLQVLAYEHGLVSEPRPMIRQRIAARRGSAPQPLYL